MRTKWYLMVITFLLGLIIGATALAYADDTASGEIIPAKVTRKIRIKHADPELIMRLLSGQYSPQPEYSTIKNTPKNTPKS